MKRRKYLTRVALFGFPNAPPELLMDVNKACELRDNFAWAQSTAT
jgi:hypothetical protein